MKVMNAKLNVREDVSGNLKDSYKIKNVESNSVSHYNIFEAIFKTKVNLNIIGSRWIK